MNKTKGQVKLRLSYLLLTATLITLPYFLTRKSPPGYIIGGDTLVHAAIARGISLGRNPFLDQTYNVYPNWYPLLYHSLVAGIASLLRISIERAMILLQAVLAVSMVLAMFYVARELWGGGAGLWSASLSLMLLTAHIYPNPKELAPILGMMSLLWFIKGRWLLSGFFLGLALWTHYAFVFPLLAFPLVFALLRREKQALLPFIIALVMFSPFVINVMTHAETPPHVEDIYQFWRTDTLEKKVLSLIPSLYLIPFLLLGLFKGIKSKDEAVKALLLFVGVVWFARLSPEVLKFFGVTLWSSRFTGLLPYTYTLLGAYGASRVDITSKKTPSVSLIILLLLLPLAGAINFWTSAVGDPFVGWSGVDFGEYFPKEHFLDVSDWILNHMGRDDVIATSEKAGMMLNALTGRPIVATMYGHGNTFLDNEQRRRDLATLFTRSCEEEQLIAEKYHVKYIILEPFVYRRWGNVNVSCIATPVYHIGNVTILEVRK